MGTAALIPRGCNCYPKNSLFTEFLKEAENKQFATGSKTTWSSTTEISTPWFHKVLILGRNPTKESTSSAKLNWDLRLTNNKTRSLPCCRTSTECGLYHQQSFMFFSDSTAQEQNPWLNLSRTGLHTRATQATNWECFTIQVSSELRQRNRIAQLQETHNRLWNWSFICLTGATKEI